MHKTLLMIVVLAGQNHACSLDPKGYEKSGDADAGGVKGLVLSPLAAQPLAEYSGDSARWEVMKLVADGIVTYRFLSDRNATWVYAGDGLTTMTLDAQVVDQAQEYSFLVGENTAWTVYGDGVTRSLPETQAGAVQVFGLPALGAAWPEGFAATSYHIVGVSLAALLASDGISIVAMHYQEGAGEMRIDQITPPEGVAVVVAAGLTKDSTYYWLCDSAGDVYVHPAADGLQKTAWQKLNYQIQLADNAVPDTLVFNLEENEGAFHINGAVVALAAGTIYASGSDVFAGDDGGGVFTNEILPLAAKHCGRCHAEATKEKWWTGRKDDNRQRLSTDNMPQAASPEAAAIGADRQVMIDWLDSL